MNESNWSVPESIVLDSIRELLKSERAGVLATIVDVEGNAYRRPGAKMLVPEDGDGVGSITAGCLEDEVLGIANDVLADGRPRIETFDLTGDDDVWGLGVGCNGIIDLLLEPVDDSYMPVLDAYNDDERIASLTVLSTDDDAISIWERAYYRPGKGFTLQGDAYPKWLIDELVDPVTRLVEKGKADTIPVEGPDGAVEVFGDGIAPPPTLVAVGTGHDVNPVVELAKKNDFRTVVVGFRGATATEDRFPQADTVVSTSPADIREAINIDGDIYLVVMTHNFLDDRIALDELVQSEAPYIGLMGPRERFEEMIEDFKAEDRTFSEAELKSVYTPVGLDLGGGTPYQIAHSIVGEILAVHNGRQPRHLKDREGPIHDRIDARSSL